MLGSNISQNQVSDAWMELHDLKRPRWLFQFIFQLFKDQYSSIDPGARAGPGAAVGIRTAQWGPLEFGVQGPNVYFGR